MKYFLPVLLCLFVSKVIAQTADILVVGAGGSGGAHRGINAGTGGGGGGGVVYVTSQPLPSGTVTVTVAGTTAGKTETTGCSGVGNVGQSSSFSNGTLVITAYGGGGGGGCNTGPGTSGGSGGGGHASNGGGSSTKGTTSGVSGTATLYGNAGGASTASNTGGGGGGASAAGTNAGAGGQGISLSISGSSVVYGSGGGGNTPSGGAGGTNAGNGAAGVSSSRTGIDAADNKGGGGGGNNLSYYESGRGGSGVVIVRYAGTPVRTGGTITQAGGYTTHTFTASGTLGAAIITTQPSSATQNVCQNASSTALTVVAAGTSITYQWYSNTSATNSGGTLISGATNNSYTPPSGTAGTRYYYCAVTSSIGSGNSAPSGAVIVSAPPVAGTLSGTQNVCTGSLRTFTSTISGGNWTSDLSTVASVNISSGVITGVAAGTATITYTVPGTGGCSNATATRTITVNALPTAGITNNSGTTVITCGNPLSVTASGGTSYSWNNGLGNNANASISAAGTNTVTVTDVNGCSSSAFIITTADNTSHWLGNSGNFHDPASWSCGVPAAAQDVLISSGTVVFNANYTATQSFILNSTASLVINPNVSFSIATGAAVDFGDRPVTVRSTLAGSGAIGKILGTLSGASNVTIERFIPQNASRAWRLLSIPTAGTQSIHESWQENNVANANTVAPGFGTLVTGPGANWASNGFDAKTSGYSMLTYDPVADALNGIAATSAGIATTSGYFLYVRGDRNAGVSSATAATSSTTLRTTGSLYQGLQGAIGVNAGNYALVGNVLPSAIDMRNITTTGGLVSTSFSVWDPKLAGSYGLGGYQTFTPDNGNYLVTPGGGSYGASASINNTIQMGQAFFVQAGGTDGTLQLDENCKTSGSTSTVFSPPATGRKFITNLYSMGDTSLSLADGTLHLVNENFENVVDGHDVKKLYNFGENFYVVTASTDLVVEKRKSFTVDDTIFFGMDGLKNKLYQLQFAASNLNETNLIAFLEDKYTNSKTPVDLNGTTTYTFKVDAIAGSAAVDRFRILFKTNAILPVTFTGIKATKQSSDVLVSWQATNEKDIQGYEVEKSINGTSFLKAGKGVVPVNGSNISSYSWIDVNATAGNNFYRIVSVGINGSRHYSPVVQVWMAAPGSGISIYPNPIKDQHIRLRFTNMPTGRYTAKLMSASGNLLLVKNIYFNTGSSLETIQIDQKLSPGNYVLKMVHPDGTISGERLVLVNR